MAERLSVSPVGTWLSLVERTLGVGEVASSNLVVPTIPDHPSLIRSKQEATRAVAFLLLGSMRRTVTWAL